MNIVLKILLISTLLHNAASQEGINCEGRPFHCVNSTHFQICVELTYGISTTVDLLAIECPPSTECRNENNFECEIIESWTSTAAMTPTSKNTNDTTDYPVVISTPNTNNIYLTDKDATYDFVASNTTVKLHNEAMTIKQNTEEKIPSSSVTLLDPTGNLPTTITKSINGSSGINKIVSDTVKSIDDQVIINKIHMKESSLPLADTMENSTLPHMGFVTEKKENNVSVNLTENQQSLKTSTTNETSGNILNFTRKHIATTESYLQIPNTSDLLMKPRENLPLLEMDTTESYVNVQAPVSLINLTENQLITNVNGRNETKSSENLTLTYVPSTNNNFSNPPKRTTVINNESHATTTNHYGNELNVSLIYLEENIHSKDIKQRVPEQNYSTIHSENHIKITENYPDLKRASDSFVDLSYTKSLPSNYVNGNFSEYQPNMTTEKYKIPLDPNLSITGNTLSTKINTLEENKTKSNMSGTENVATKEGNHSDNFRSNQSNSAIITNISQGNITITETHEIGHINTDTPFNGMVNYNKMDKAYDDDNNNKNKIYSEFPKSVEPELLKLSTEQDKYKGSYNSEIEASTTERNVIKNDNNSDIYRSDDSHLSKMGSFETNLTSELNFTTGNSNFDLIENETLSDDINSIITRHVSNKIDAVEITGNSTKNTYNSAKVISTHNDISEAPKLINFNENEMNLSSISQKTLLFENITQIGLENRHTTMVSRIENEIVNSTISSLSTKNNKITKETTEFTKDYLTLFPNTTVISQTKEPTERNTKNNPDFSKNHPLLPSVNTVRLNTSLSPEINEAGTMPIDNLVNFNKTNTNNTSFPLHTFEILQIATDKTLKSSDITNKSEISTTNKSSNSLHQVQIINELSHAIQNTDIADKDISNNIGTRINITDNVLLAPINQSELIIIEVNPIGRSNLTKALMNSDNKNKQTYNISMSDALYESTTLPSMYNTGDLINITEVKIENNEHNQFTENVYVKNASATNINDFSVSTQEPELNSNTGIETYIMNVNKSESNISTHNKHKDDVTVTTENKFEDQTNSIVEFVETTKVNNIQLSPEENVYLTSRTEPMQIITPSPQLQKSYQESITLKMESTPVIEKLSSNIVTDTNKVLIISGPSNKSATDIFLRSTDLVSEGSDGTLNNGITTNENSTHYLNSSLNMAQGQLKYNNTFTTEADPMASYFQASTTVTEVLISANTDRVTFENEVGNNIDSLTDITGNGSISSLLVSINSTLNQTEMDATHIILIPEINLKQSFTDIDDTNMPTYHDTEINTIRESISIKSTYNIWNSTEVPETKIENIEKITEKNKVKNISGTNDIFFSLTTPEQGPTSNASSFNLHIGAAYGNISIAETTSTLHETKHNEINNFIITTEKAFEDPIYKNKTSIPFIEVTENNSIHLSVEENLVVTPSIVIVTHSPQTQISHPETITFQIESNPLLGNNTDKNIVSSTSDKQEKTLNTTEIARKTTDITTNINDTSIITSTPSNERVSEILIKSTNLTIENNNMMTELPIPKNGSDSSMTITNLDQVHLNYNNEILTEAVKTSLQFPSTVTNELFNSTADSDVTNEDVSNNIYSFINVTTKESIDNLQILINSTTNKTNVNKTEFIPINNVDDIHEPTHNVTESAASIKHISIPAMVLMETTNEENQYNQYTENLDESNISTKNNDNLKTIKSEMDNTTNTQTFQIDDVYSNKSVSNNLTPINDFINKIDENDHNEANVSQVSKSEKVLDDQLYSIDPLSNSNIRNNAAIEHNEKSNINYTQTLTEDYYVTTLQIKQPDLNASHSDGSHWNTIALRFESDPVTESMQDNKSTTMDRATFKINVTTSTPAIVFHQSNETLLPLSLLEEVTEYSNNPLLTGAITLESQQLENIANSSSFQPNIIIVSENPLTTTEDNAKRLVEYDSNISMVTEESNRKSQDINYNIESVTASANILSVVSVEPSMQLNTSIDSSNSIKINEPEKISSLASEMVTDVNVITENNIADIKETTYDLAYHTTHEMSEASVVSNDIILENTQEYGTILPKSTMSPYVTISTNNDTTEPTSEINGFAKNNTFTIKVTENTTNEKISLHATELDAPEAYMFVETPDYAKSTTTEETTLTKVSAETTVYNNNYISVFTNLNATASKTTDIVTNINDTSIITSTPSNERVSEILIKSTNLTIEKNDMMTELPIPNNGSDSSMTITNLDQVYSNYNNEILTEAVKTSLQSPSTVTNELFNSTSDSDVTNEDVSNNIYSLINVTTKESIDNLQIFINSTTHKTNVNETEFIPINNVDDMHEPKHNVTESAASIKHISIPAMVLMETTNEENQYNQNTENLDESNISTKNNDNLKTIKSEMDNTTNTQTFQIDDVYSNKSVSNNLTPTNDFINKIDENDHNEANVSQVSKSEKVLDDQLYSIDPLSNSNIRNNAAIEHNEKININDTQKLSEDYYVTTLQIKQPGLNASHSDGSHWNTIALRFESDPVTERMQDNKSTTMDRATSKINVTTSTPAIVFHQSNEILLPLSLLEEVTEYSNNPLLTGAITLESQQLENIANSSSFQPNIIMVSENPLTTTEDNAKRLVESNSNISMVAKESNRNTQDINYNIESVTASASILSVISVEPSMQLNTSISSSNSIKINEPEKISSLASEMVTEVNVITENIIADIKETRYDSAYHTTHEMSEASILSNDINIEKAQEPSTILPKSTTSPYVTISTNNDTIEQTSEINDFAKNDTTIIEVTETSTNAKISLHATELHAPEVYMFVERPDYAKLTTIAKPTSTQISTETITYNNTYVSVNDPPGGDIFTEETQIKIPPISKVERINTFIPGTSTEHSVSVDSNNVSKSNDYNQLIKTSTEYWIKPTVENVENRTNHAYSFILHDLNSLNTSATSTNEKSPQPEAEYGIINSTESNVDDTTFLNNTTAQFISETKVSVTLGAMSQINDSSYESLSQPIAIYTKKPDTVEIKSPYPGFTTEFVMAAINHSVSPNTTNTVIRADGDSGTVQSNTKYNASGGNQSLATDIFTKTSPLADIIFNNAVSNIPTTKEINEISMIEKRKNTDSIFLSQNTPSLSILSKVSESITLVDGEKMYNKNFSGSANRETTQSLSKSITSPISSIIVDKKSHSFSRSTFTTLTSNDGTNTKYESSIKIDTTDAPLYSGSLESQFRDSIETSADSRTDSAPSTLTSKTNSLEKSENQTSRNITTLFKDTDSQKQKSSYLPTIKLNTDAVVLHLITAPSSNSNRLKIRHESSANLTTTYITNKDNKIKTEETTQQSSTPLSSPTYQATEHLLSIDHDDINTTNTSMSEIPPGSQFAKTNNVMKHNQTQNNINSTNTYFDCKNKQRGRYPDTSNSQRFYVCIGKQRPIVCQCPQTYIYSISRNRCTKYCPQFHCTVPGRFQDKCSANSYYICQNNAQHRLVRYKLTCQTGYHVNTTTVRCTRNSIPKTKLSSSSIIITKTAPNNEDITSTHDKNDKLDLIKDHVLNSKTVKIQRKQANKKQERRDNEEKDKSNEDSNSSQERDLKEKEVRIQKRKSSEEKYVFKCVKEGKFADPNDGRKYYVCKYNGKETEFRRRVKKCDDDEIFNKKKTKCVENESYESLSD